MLPDFATVEEAVRQWAATAGVHVDQITLSKRGRPVLVLPVPAQPPGGDTRGRALSPVVTDLLNVLEETGKPLTTTRILQALAKKGIDWSERSVSGHLAKLVEEGTVLNPAGAQPPGYRLPE